MQDIGKINELNPKTSPILAIFEPTALPTDKDELSFNAAVILTISSGKEVPPATITTPIANKETFNFLPRLTEPLIINSAPKTRNIKPTINNNKFTKN